MTFFTRSLLAVFISASVLSLSGCFGNASQARITSDYVSTVKSVGVVSLLSPTVNVSFLAPSAQESVFSRLALSGWNSDELVYEVVLPRLRRKGFTVRALSRNDRMNEARDSDWRPPLSDSVAEAAYAMGASAGLDVVVVVQAQVDEDFVTETNQKVRGFGIQQAFDTGPFIYASVFVEAYDIKNRFAVGRAGGRLFEAAPEGLWRPSFAVRGVQPELSVAAQAAMVEPLSRVLKTAIGVATQEAGL